ncbi:hypothetical protein MKEN_00884700 [Mycena kentingensis (nom. inval.)]|nr:hypothetical protein MKEN_00884700 [Mycena kentingensis (nom. inval.)]
MFQLAPLSAVAALLAALGLVLWQKRPVNPKKAKSYGLRKQLQPPGFVSRCMVPQSEDEEAGEVLLDNAQPPRNTWTGVAQSICHYIFLPFWTWMGCSHRLRILLSDIHLVEQNNEGKRICASEAPTTALDASQSAWASLLENERGVWKFMGGMAFPTTLTAFYDYPAIGISRLGHFGVHALVGIATIVANGVLLHQPDNNAKTFHFVVHYQARYNGGTSLRTAVPPISFVFKVPYGITAFNTLLMSCACLTRWTYTNMHQYFAWVEPHVVQTFKTTFLVVTGCLAVGQMLLVLNVHCALLTWKCKWLKRPVQRGGASSTIRVNKSSQEDPDSTEEPSSDASDA